jgi:hypothetical protein
LRRKGPPVARRLKESTLTRDPAELAGLAELIQQQLLQVTASRPCPTAADPQLACFAVEMRNAGDKAGKGRCVVYHYMRDSETEVGEGPSFEARLRPGEVLRAQGQAHLTVPFGWLRFNSTNCNPGYRL